MRLCSGSLIKHIVFNIVLDKTLGNELFPLSIPIILKTGTDWPAVRARLCFCSLTDMKYQVKNVSGIFWVNWLSRFKITRFCPSMEQSKLNQLLSNSLSVSSVVLVQFLGQLFYKNYIISTVKYRNIKATILKSDYFQYLQIALMTIIPFQSLDICSFSLWLPMQSKWWELLKMIFLIWLMFLKSIKIILPIEWPQNVVEVKYLVLDHKKSNSCRYN